MNPWTGPIGAASNRPGAVCLADRHRAMGQVTIAANTTAHAAAATQPGKPEVVVTLRVIGDDLADYLDIGSHFILWSGRDVGQGVVTRRLFH